MKWIFFSLVGWSLFAQAATNAGGSFFAIDGGAYVDNIGQRLEAPTGYAQQVSRFSGFLRFRPGVHLGNRFYLEPSLGLLLPWRTGNDGGSKIFTFQTSLDFGIPLASFLEFRVGPGLHSLLFLSSAQAIELNNGTSTSTFYQPGAVSLAFNLTAQAGFSIYFTRSVCLNLDGYVLAVASRSRRTFNAAASLGVHL